jgi:hypothetical protein
VGIGVKDLQEPVALLPHRPFALAILVEDLNIFGDGLLELGVEASL